MAKKLGFVQEAVDADIETTRDWLDRYPGVDFLSVNCPPTLHVYRTKGLLVFQDHDSKSPMAYFWGTTWLTQTACLKFAMTSAGKASVGNLSSTLIAKAREAGSLTDLAGRMFATHLARILVSHGIYCLV
jgi:hypothetical protein